MKSVYFSGRSGVGKTYLSKRFHEATTSSTYFPLDGYIKYDRKFRESRNISSVEVSSYNILEYQADLDALRSGRTAIIPTYDHTTGRHGEPLKLSPSQLIIIDGLHSFVAIKRPRNSLSIFMDRSLADWKRQKITRDIHERHINEKRSLEQIEMNLAIETTFLQYKSSADIVLDSRVCGLHWSYLVSGQIPNIVSRNKALHDEDSLFTMLKHYLDRVI